MIVAFYLKDHGYILCDEISSTLDIPNIAKGDRVLLPYLQGGDIIDKFFEVDEISHQFQKDRCIIAKTVYTVKPICQRKKEMIAILDYSSALVHLGYIDEDKDVEEYMKENGFDFDACYYMTADHITLEKCL